MTLDEIKNLSNEELLDLYSDFVREHHYSPSRAPDKIMKLYENKISPDDVQEVVLERMTRPIF
jgi:hypothetical protein